MAHFARRTAAVVAGTALAFSLAAVPTAGAQATCGTEASRNFSNAGTVWTKYKTQNKVMGGGQAAPGGELTYQVAVTGAGALITEVRHHHDPALTPVRARVSSFKLIGGSPTWSDHTSSMDTSGDTVKVGSGGWTTAGGNAAVLEVTYKVPDDAVVGTKYDSGAGFKAALIGVDPDFNPMGVCGTVREPNAVESAQGSLEGLGAGSLVEGSTTSSNLSSDPTSMSSDLINGLDIGKLLGGAIGS